MLLRKLSTFNCHYFGKEPLMEHSLSDGTFACLFKIGIYDPPLAAICCIWSLCNRIYIPMHCAASTNVYAIEHFSPHLMWVTFSFCSNNKIATTETLSAGMFWYSELKGASHLSPSRATDTIPSSPASRISLSLPSVAQVTCRKFSPVVSRRCGLGNLNGPGISNTECPLQCCEPVLQGPLSSDSMMSTQQQLSPLPALSLFVNGSGGGNWGALWS